MHLYLTESTYFAVCFSDFVFATSCLMLDPFDNLRLLDVFLPLGEVFIEFDFLVDGDFLFGELLTFFGVDTTRARLSHGRAAIHLSIQLQPQLDVATSESFELNLELD